MMGHIKLWENILDCPKVHRLSDRAFRVWAKCLVTALRNGGRNGEFPLRETLEFKLRMPWSEIESSIAEMHQCGLIDPCLENAIGGMPWRIHDWDEWQTSKDSKGAERQRRWREKQASRNASRNGVSNGGCDAVEGKKDRRKKNTPSKPPKGGGVASFAPPDWIPREPWDAWLESRKRKPTLRALEMAVEKLEKLKGLGSDPGEVLSQTVVNGWTGLFEVSKSAARKGENNGKTSVQQKPEDTVGKLQRPDLPRRPEFEHIHQYWDDIEAGRPATLRRAAQ